MSERGASLSIPVRNRDCILGRIDSALERMRAEGVGVRFIYLTEKTHDAFDKAMCKRIKAERGLKRYKAAFLSYGEHQIRRGFRDSIYSEQGVEFTIPKRLSPRVQKLAA